jgi:hypothetical protein
MASKMIIEPFTGGLLKEVNAIESKAFTALVISDFVNAEKLYAGYYKLLRDKEIQELPANKKYHKGTPLHNWGIVLLNQGKIAEGFSRIILAYIEDLLNFPNPEDAFNAPAYKTLFSNAIIDKSFLNEIYGIAGKVREEGMVPKNPEEIIAQYKATKGGKADLSASFTVKSTDEVPTITDASNATVPQSGVPSIADILKSLG